MLCLPERAVRGLVDPGAGRWALHRGQLFGGAETLQNLQEGEEIALNERKEKTLPAEG